MKALVFVFLLLAVVALGAPNHDASKDLQDIDTGNVSLLKTTKAKPTTTTTTTTTTTEATTTTLPSTTVTTTLPPSRGDYTLVGSYGYYKLHKEYKDTWAEAWEACNKEGAHLLVVRSEAEFNSLYYWKPNEMPTFIYYGVHHRYANHKFVTIFDEPLKSIPYRHWGWDYSDATEYNNKDYPVTVLVMTFSLGNTGIYLTKEDTPYRFVCKQEI